MSRSKQKSGLGHLHSDGGAVLIELCLTVGLLILLICACLEFSKALRTIEIASLLSRESASIAFRDCAADVGEKLSSCLELTRRNMEQFGRQVAGSDVDVVLSVYTAPPGGEVSRAAYVTGGQVATAIEPQTIASAVRSQRLLVVAEAHVTFQSVFTDSRRVFWFRPLRLYDLTMI